MCVRVLFKLLSEEAAFFFFFFKVRYMYSSVRIVVPCA